jgi:hypothetical protein
MTAEFDRVRTMFSASLAGRTTAAACIAARAAWRSSAIVSVLRPKLATHPPAIVVRTAAIAVAVAAVVQPVVIQLMPAAAKPVLPAATYFAVALIATGIAITSADIVRAWPASRPWRWLR